MYMRCAAASPPAPGLGLVPMSLILLPLDFFQSSILSPIQPMQIAPSTSQAPPDHQNPKKTLQQHPPKNTHTPQKKLHPIPRRRPPLPLPLRALPRRGHAGRPALAQLLQLEEEPLLDVPVEGGLGPGHLCVLWVWLVWFVLGFDARGSPHGHKHSKHPLYTHTSFKKQSPRAGWAGGPGTRAPPPPAPARRCPARSCWFVYGCVSVWSCVRSSVHQPVR